MTEPLHFSRLKLMALSPAHYRHGYRTETRALGFGTIVHALVLGGDAIVFDGERKGAAWSAFKTLVNGEAHHVYDGAHRGKEWLAAKDEAGDRPIVTSEDVERAARGAAMQAARRASGRYELPIVTRAEYDRARECADAVLSHEEARGILTGAREAPLTWTYLGRPCAGQLDVLGPDHVAELKTASCAEPSWFARQAFKLAYPAQLRWYQEGARCNGFRASQAFIVAVEPRPPYAITTFRVTDRALDEGERIVREWMERLAVCEEAQHWPAYCQSTVDLDGAPDVELIFPEDEETEAA